MKGLYFWKTCLVSVTTALLITGCGDSSNQIIEKAPNSEADLGVLSINLPAEEKASLLEEFPGAKVRVLSETAGIYEFLGLDQKLLEQRFPHVTFEKNDFVNSNRIQSRNSLEGAFARIANETSNTDFNIRNCREYPFDPIPDIRVIAGPPRPTLFPGDELTFSSKGTRSFSQRPFRKAWVIVPPLGSGIVTKFIEDEEFDLKFDMAGIYQIILFTRQGDNCNMDSVQIPVTSNPEPQVLTAREAQRALASEVFLGTPSHLKNMGIREAQRNSQKGANVVLAILDSGVNYNHPSLSHKIWTNPNEQLNGEDSDGNLIKDDIMGYDFVNRDPYPMDDEGHGSHVATLAAGNFYGVATEAKIMAVKVMSNFGVSDRGTILAGLVYAIEHKADIINMSLGGTQNPGEIYKQIVAQANERGILIVTAAGNGDPIRGRSVNNDRIPNYPSSMDNVNILAVGSSSAEGRLTSYSNYGLNSVDLLAMGGEVIQNPFTGELIRKQLTAAYIPNPSGILSQELSGTSMAAPIVAGAAAILKGEYPDLTPEETISILMSSGKKIRGLERITKSGAILDVNAALTLAQSLEQEVSPLAF